MTACVTIRVMIVTRHPSLCYIMTGPGTMKIVTDIKTD